MKTKSFIWGLLTGLGIVLVPLIGFFIYVSVSFAPGVKKSMEALTAPREIYPKLNASISLVPVLGDSALQQLSFLKNSKTVIINRWATWCKPCIAEMHAFEELSSQLGADTELYFLSDEDPAVQQELINKKGWTLPFYYSADSLPKPLRSKQLPTTYIIKNGIIYYKQVGKADWNSSLVLDFIEGLR